MGVYCCGGIKYNRLVQNSQKEESEANSGYLMTYYEMNKNYMNQKVKVIFKEINAKGKYERTTVDLNFVNFEKNRLEYLIRLFPYFKGIKVLKLWKSGLGCEGIKAIYKDLEHLNLLEILSFEDNDIGPIGAMYLASTLENLCKLKELWLHVNNIGPDGASSIASVLEHLKDLTSLGLDDNLIERTGALKIVSALQHHQIKQLNLGYNAISNEACQSLGKILRHSDIDLLIISGNFATDTTLSLLSTLLPKTKIIA